MSGVLYYVFAILLFVAVVLFVEGIYVWWNDARGPEARRIESRLRLMSAGGHDDKKSFSILKERMLADSPAMQRALLRVPRIHLLDRLIEQSGLSWSVAQLLGIMLAFGIVWIGQVISFIGSGISSFALGVWIYQKTGSVTQFALTSLFIVLPRVVLGPLAGALVDRWDRRNIMILSDTGGGLSILAIGLLSLAGRLEIWHIYLAIFATGIFDTLRWPAMTAATTQLVPKEHIGRASGMLQIVSAGTVLVSPSSRGR